MKWECEVVQVVDGNRLIDSESYERLYYAQLKRALRPGFYFIMWPATSIDAKYDKRARYFGPYAGQAPAEQLRRMAVWFGLENLAPLVAGAPQHQPSNKGLPPPGQVKAITRVYDKTHR